MEIVYFRPCPYQNDKIRSTPISRCSHSFYFFPFFFLLADSDHKKYWLIPELTTQSISDKTVLHLSGININFISRDGSLITCQLTKSPEFGKSTCLPKSMPTGEFLVYDGKKKDFYNEGGSWSVFYK